MSNQYIVSTPAKVKGMINVDDKEFEKKVRMHKRKLWVIANDAKKECGNGSNNKKNRALFRSRWHQADALYKD